MTVGYRFEDELNDRVVDHVTRIRASEFRTGMENSYERVYVDMGERQREAYLSMRDELYAEVDSGVLTVEYAMVQGNKLLQISSGFLYDGDRNVTHLSDCKVDATEALCERHRDEPLIVWCPWVPLRERLSQRLPSERLHVFENVDTVKRWREDPRGILLANQVGGAGTGLNLQHARIAIYTSNVDRAEARWQSEWRTDRIGQERQCLFYDIMARHSSDEKVLARQAVKEGRVERSVNQISRDIRELF